MALTTKKAQLGLSKRILEKGLQHYGRKGWRKLSDAEQKAFIARGVLHHLVRSL